VSKVADNLTTLYITIVQDGDLNAVPAMIDELQEKKNPTSAKLLQRKWEQYIHAIQHAERVRTEALHYSLSHLVYTIGPELIRAGWRSLEEYLNWKADNRASEATSVLIRYVQRKFRDMVQVTIVKHVAAKKAMRSLLRNEYE